MSLVHTSVGKREEMIRGMTEEITGRMIGETTTEKMIVGTTSPRTIGVMYIGRMIDVTTTAEMIGMRIIGEMSDVMIIAQIDATTIKILDWWVEMCGDVQRWSALEREGCTGASQVLAILVYTSTVQYCSIVNDLYSVHLT